MRFLDPGQVVDLIDVTLDYYRPLVWRAAYVGLRWGELAGLKVTIRGSLCTAPRSAGVCQSEGRAAGERSRHPPWWW